MGNFHRRSLERVNEMSGIGTGQFMEFIRVGGNIVNDHDVGDRFKVGSGNDWFMYDVIEKGINYLDLRKAEYVKPELKPTPPQKYYQKFNKGWNR